MDNGFPKFPLEGDYLRFIGNYPFRYESTGNNYTPGEMEKNDIVQVLRTEVHSEGYADTTGYYLYLGLVKYDKMLVLKIDYTKHFNKLEIIPATQASQVLFGKKNDTKI